MKKNLKMFLVKREVRAKNIKEAMVKPGRIYSIEEAVDVFQDEIDNIGFEKNANNTTKDSI